MADYAGAKEAIKQRLIEQWARATPLVFKNDPPPDPWPPVDHKGAPAPWVFCEIVGLDSNNAAIGIPGNKPVVDDGLIKMTVYDGIGKGTTASDALAVTLGEIFREKRFFDSEPQTYVRTWVPRTTDGGSASAEGIIKGSWYGTTVTVPFEFYHRG